MELTIFNKVEGLTNDLVQHDSIDLEENNLNNTRKSHEYIDLEEMVEIVEEERGIALPESVLKYCYISSIHLDWTYSKDVNWLYGGARFNFFDCLAFPSNFWKLDHDPPASKTEEEFLNKLVYFQRSGHGDDGTFGCFLREEGQYPCDIYFYDKGIYWKLDLTLDEYFDKLIEYKTVASWQYFYIETEDLIKKLEGVTCKAWSFITFSDIKEEAPRIEGVLYHMNMIVSLFPKLFPDVDLSHAIAQRDSLSQALGK